VKQTSPPIKIAPLLCLGIAVIGLALLAASYFWQVDLGQKSAWTEEQAEALSAASARYHQMQYEHATSRDSKKTLHSEMQRKVTTGELIAARDEWETRQAALKRAQGRISYWKSALWVLGIIAAVGGGAGFLITNHATTAD
jgi:hypothetical protein